MKNKEKKQKESLLKRLLKWWFLILLVLFFLYKAGIETYQNYILKQNGLCTKAIVYNRYGYGRRGKVNTQYKFVWNNKIYYGESSLDDKYRETDKWYRTNKDLIVGDTIVIVFLLSDPEVNKSNSIIEKNCNCK